MPELPGSDVDLPVRPAARLPRRWRAVEIAVLVAAVCYGAAALIVAAGLFVRLAH